MKARMLRLKNTTDVPTPLVKDILKFVTPENIKPVEFTVTVTNASYSLRGRYMGYRQPRVLARVAKRFKPHRIALYQDAQNKGKKLAVTSKVEALVYILAHEMRHLWQHHGSVQHSSFPTGYAKNARGRFSEVDTESYAVNRLRAWRRREAIW